MSPASSSRSPLTAVALGAVAGALGTLAMDVLWWRRAAAGADGDPPAFADFEVVTGTSSAADAGAPAQVAAKAAHLVGAELPGDASAPAANAVHWATGIGWGALYGASVAARHHHAALDGPALGATAWATAYALLAPLGIYRPPWEYEVETLGRDLSAHLLFGSVTATVHRALSPGSTSGAAAGA